METQMQTTGTEPPSAVEELQEFAYIVSHDLNAPLRECVSFSRLLQERYLPTLDERGRHYLTHVLHGGSQAQAMLDGLLHYSRLNTLAKPMTELVDTAVLVASCIGDLRGRIKEIGAVIDFGILPVVRGDGEQLRKLFFCLLENSLKFIQQDRVPCITIYAAQTERVVRFCVHDNGIGIDALEMDEIFKPLRRPYRVEHYPGVGIGLALAHKIVTRHGGRIWAESVLGEGTDVWFELPRERAEDEV